MGKKLIIKGADFSNVAIDEENPNYEYITITFNDSNQVAGKTNDYHHVWVDNPFVAGKTYKIYIEISPDLICSPAKVGTASNAFKVGTCIGEAESYEDTVAIVAITQNDTVITPDNPYIFAAASNSATKLDFFTQRSNASNANPITVTLAYKEVIV